LYRCSLRGELVFADDDDKRYAAAVGVFHLFLHLGRLRIDFGRDARIAYLLEQPQGGELFRAAEIDEEHARGDGGLFREEVQGQHDVVDAVRTERDADARHARHSENTRQVVVPSAAADASYRMVFGLHFEDGARVIVESAGERKVEFDVEV